MNTEREITEAVDLCMPDGRTLAPAAKGWSRRPLHRANLRGVWGRTKRWDYWAILAGDLLLSVTYADVDYIGMATVWWADIATGRTGGHDTILPFARGVDLPERPGTEPLRYAGKRLRLDLVDDAGGTRITAAWTEKDGRAATLDAYVEQPAGHESLNVVIPWSVHRFQYTSKHQARPARGVLSLGGEARAFGGDAGDAWGVLDVGRGRWPYSTQWNWGGGAGRSADGAHVVGIQIGAKWTAGTGFTENGVLVDGRLHKLGDELDWQYDWDAPMKPWRVRDPSGRLDLTLEPAFDRYSKIDLLVLRTEVHQVFGRWTGTVTSESGEIVTVAGVEGFAEESRSRW